MRSVSESDHCKPISLPIVAFTKSTGQIDGRYSPEDSKNYSNPNLISYLESDNECRKYGFTETDLVANIQPRPNSQKQNNGQEVIQIEKDNQQKAGPVNTPLIMNYDEQIDEYDQGTTGPVYTPLIMNDDEKIDEYDQGPLLTPPETPSESIGQENESSGCCSICLSVCCALVQREHLFDRFSVLNLLLTLVSMGLFVFDVYSDLKLAATYYTKIEDNEIYRVYFGLTLGFVIMPSLITQIYSYFVQVKHDFSNSKLLMYFFIHFFQLGVIFSYIRVIYYGLKLRYYECVKMEEDRSKLEGKYEIEVVFATINSLLESFMESAPQLVLQIYIMLMTKTVPLITVISCAGSLLSLSTTTVSTQRFYRVLNDKMQLSIPASIVILFWKACTILSRVVVFGLFMTVQPIVFFVCIILHWLVATVLIGKDLHEVWITYAYGMLLNGIYGFIYIFCFIDLHDVGNRTNIRIRSRMFIFYAVVVIENVVISCWWYLTQLRSHTGLPFGNLSSTSSNETSTSFPFGNLSSTSSNETSTSLPFGNLSSTSSNETIVENELFPTESAGIFPRQQAFIILVAVHGFFLLGMFFMQVYYQALHPKHSDSDLNSDLHSNSDSHSKSDLDSAF